MSKMYHVVESGNPSSLHLLTDENLDTLEAQGIRSSVYELFTFDYDENAVHNIMIHYVNEFGYEKTVEIYLD